MAGSLPPMLQVMKDIGGVEIPTSLAKLAGEDSATSSGNGQAAAERTSSTTDEAKAEPVKTRA
jgi:flotillin